MTQAAQTAETKHTAGPWAIRAGFFDNELEIYPTRDGEMPEVGDWAELATVEGDYGEEGEGEANARLIAAAPDMVDALRPFALVAERDIGSDEDDADLFQVMREHNHVPKLTVGDLRRALEAYVKAAQS